VSRFGFVWGVLAGVAVCAVAITGVLIGTADRESGPPLARDWSAWQPSTARMFDELECVGGVKISSISQPLGQLCGKRDAAHSREESVPFGDENDMLVRVLGRVDAPKLELLDRFERHESIRTSEVGDGVENLSFECPSHRAAWRFKFFHGNTGVGLDQQFIHRGGCGEDQANGVQRVRDLVPGRCAAAQLRHAGHQGAQGRRRARPDDRLLQPSLAGQAGDKSFELLKKHGQADGRFI